MELLQLEGIILTQLKTRVTKDIGEKYTTLTFTNEISDKAPSFPNIYVHELEPSEVGMTIPNQKIRAIRETIQVEVSTNTTKSDAKSVMSACIRAIKALRYSVFLMPTYNKVNNVHRYIIRARRIVADGDTF